MTLSKKDLARSSNLATRIMRVVKILERPLRPIFRLGFIRRLLERTASGRVGVISRYTKLGEHDRAADLAIELLKETRHRPSRSWSWRTRDYWWMYMHIAARSLEKTGDEEKQELVIAMAKEGVEPFKGYYVAKSYLAFSRWTYRDGDHDSAIELAQTAADADDTWAEPEFVLGWYRLVLNRGDALPHFTRAVQIDPKMLSHIVENPQCQKHPEMIEKLSAWAAESAGT